MDTTEEVALIINEEAMKSINCSLCEKYLSVPPVYIISEDGKKYKCGRCRVKSYVHCRAFMYEKLAKNLSFPCVFKGCLAVVPFKDVQKHEEDCEFKVLKCIARGCKEELKLEELSPHIKETHAKIFYDDSVKLKNVHTTYGVCFLVQPDNQYIILFDMDSQVLGFSVSSMVKTNKRFDMTLSSPESKVTLRLRNRKIDLFNRNFHCYECVRGICEVACHEHKDYRRGFLKTISTVVERDLITKTYGKSTVIYKLDIVDEKPEPEVDSGDILLENQIVIDDADEEEVEDDQEDGIVQKQDKEFKKLFECSNEGCEQQLSSPIFQCITGHSICGDCKSKTGLCNVCHTKIESTRNFVLEELDANLKQEKIEEPVDTSKTITCPLPKCTVSSDLKNISEHFLEKHMENIHYNVASIKNVYTYLGMHILIKDDNTYLIHLDYDDVYLAISIYSFVKDDHEYEVTLSSEDNKYSVTAIRQKISVFDDIENCFKCRTGTCKKNNHPNRKRKFGLLKKLNTKFHRLQIRATFATPTLNYKIKIVEPKAYVEKDKLLRLALECPICHYYMIPPIHQCVSGHTLCNVCRGRLTKCPSCEGEIKETQNLSLEEACNTAEVSCQNESEQCAYRAVLKKMTGHDSECRKSGNGGPVSKKPYIVGDKNKS